MGVFTLARPRKVESAALPASRLSDRERLTAGWIALAALLIAVRCWVLWLGGKSAPAGPALVAWLPVAVYQDVALTVGLAWLTNTMLRTGSHPFIRWFVRAAAWTVCVLAAWYAVVSVHIFSFLNTPLTYRLILMSDNLRGIRTSVDAALTTERLSMVLAVPLITLAVAAALILLLPGVMRWVRDVSARPRARVAMIVYLTVAAGATKAAGVEPTLLANPHWALIASLWEPQDAFVAGEWDESHVGDFRPAALRASVAPSSWHGRIARANVILIVMESVGAEPLRVYNSPHDTTPELRRLAEGGITFDRIYASQPYTSNAMAGMFCSLYPWHGWRSLPRRAPDLNVTGLGNVLQQQGYRTAMLHTGDMQFDHEKRFLQVHGFQEVHDVWTLGSLLSEDGQRTGPPPETPGVHLHLPDRLLLPAALRWIDQHRDGPFFLGLWTIQTHHPYFAEPLSESFVADDPELNRYLNAIRVADQLLGELMRELDRRGLTESTLLVVTGDHGEAFGQHAHRGHSKTLYNEELHIPLIMVSPGLADGPRRWPALGQQIDLAPTILDLIGMESPAEWQGRSLFAEDRAGRGYFFTAFHHYLFGVVDGDRKYVYNATTGRRQLYDLRADPAERVNRIRSPADRAAAEEMHRRLASWVQFQNPYLSQFLPAPNVGGPSPVVLGN